MTRKDVTIVAAVVASLGLLCLIGGLIIYLSPSHHDDTQTYGSVGKYTLIKKLDLNLPEYAKYLAQDSQSRTKVIIKRGGYVAREMSILKTLEHPNICRFIEGSVEERFIAFEAVSGHFLNQLLTRGHPTDDGIRQLLFDTVSALVYLHSQKLAHSDLDVSKILVSDAGHVKLFGFEYTTSENFDIKSQNDIYSVGTILVCCFGYCPGRLYTKYTPSALLLMGAIKDPMLKSFFDAIFAKGVTADSLLQHEYFANMTKGCRKDLGSFVLGSTGFRNEFSLMSLLPSNEKPLFEFEDLITVTETQESRRYLGFNLPNGVGAEALLVGDTIHTLVKKGALVLYSRTRNDVLNFASRTGSPFRDIRVQQKDLSPYQKDRCVAGGVVAFLLPLVDYQSKFASDAVVCTQRIIKCINDPNQSVCMQNLKGEMEKEQQLEFHIFKIIQSAAN